MARLTLVTLDVTGTCMKVTRSVGYHYSKIAQEFGLRLDAVQLDKGFRSAFKWANSLYPCFGVAQGLTSQQWWSMLVSDSLTSVGVEKKGNLHAAVGERLYSYFADSDKWEAFPDTRRTLQQIKNAGLKLGAISNFDERLGGILSGLGIGSYFDFVVTSHEVQSAKPEPEIFRLALEKADVAASSALHVGDNYELDYQAAKKAGMMALLLARDSEEAVQEKALVVRSLDEVLQYVDSGRFTNMR